MLKKGALTGSVNIYRNDFNGPLTERDLFLLEVFMGHLENLLGKLLQQSSSRRLLDYEKIPGFEKLSEREAELFPFVLRGFSNGELAEKFCISESTVKKHIYNILLKFDVNSRGRLIRRCLDESGESGR